MNSALVLREVQLKDSNRLCGGNVPEPHRLVGARGSQHATVTRKADTRDRTTVSLQNAASAPGYRVPERDGTIRARSCKNCSVGREGQAANQSRFGLKHPAQIP